MNSQLNLTTSFEHVSSSSQLLVLLNIMGKSEIVRGQVLLLDLSQLCSWAMPLVLPNRGDKPSVQQFSDQASLPRTDMLHSNIMDTLATHLETLRS
eukprot:5450514-Amphidinium_carterae.1